MRGNFCRLGTSLCVLLGAIGCGSSPDAVDDTTGGSSNEAGTQATGGSSGTAGAKATGGSTGTGGAKATGGSTGTGGAKATGGSTGTGGTSGEGGATGTGGSPGTGGSTQPHSVGACDALGPVGQVSQINPPQVTPASDALGTFVIGHPQIAGTIYSSVGTWAGNRGFYRSTDCGATWAKVATGRNAAAINSGFQWSMAVDPTDGEVIYAANGYGSPPEVFKTTNGGVDWDSLWPPGSDVMNATGTNFAQGLDMDPTNPKHLVVTLHDNCKGAYAPMCMTETTDGGATWRVFKGPTGGWEEGAAPVIIAGSKFLYSAGFAGLFYTSDSGNTWEKVGDGGSGQLYRSADGTYYLGSLTGVLKSSDGHAWTKITGSPPSSGLIGTGTFIYTTAQANKNTQPFYSAPESSPTVWSKVPSAAYAEGGSHIDYDKDHHVIYASAYQGGLLRLVVE